MLFPQPQRHSSPPRIVVTGAGVISALGVGWDANSRGFRSGRSNFRPVSLFDITRNRVRQAAEVDLPDALPNSNLSARQRARIDRATRMLLHAAFEAWGRSGWKAAGHIPMVLGTTAGGMSLGEDYFRHALQCPRTHVGQPSRALHYQSHIQARILAEALGISGPITIVGNACATGASAIGIAWEQLRRGHADRVLTGGYDALSQMVFAGFDSLQAMSKTVCRPFDACRDGLTLGEGAAVLTLETLESAQIRGAQIFGEIIGYDSSIDLHHLTQPHPAGDAALRSMERACEMARITPRDVDYINAHGTGTPLNDSAEAHAINRWAGDAVDSVKVSSTKASIGHTLGAAGAIEAVVCLMAIREQWLPPELALITPDPICRFQLVQKPMDSKVQIAVSNSFGFGGVNATLVFRRWS